MVQFDCQILHIHAKQNVLFGEKCIHSQPFLILHLLEILCCIFNAFLWYFAKGSAMNWWSEQLKFHTSSVFFVHLKFWENIIMLQNYSRVAYWVFIYKHIALSCPTEVNGSFATDNSRSRKRHQELRLFACLLETHKVVAPLPFCVQGGE